MLNINTLVEFHKIVYKNGLSYSGGGICLTISYIAVVGCRESELMTSVRAVGLE